MKRQYVTREEANQLVQLGIPVRFSAETVEWLDTSPDYTGLEYGYWWFDEGIGIKSFWTLVE